MKHIVLLFAVLLGVRLSAQSISAESLAEMAKHHRVQDLTEVLAKPSKFWRKALESTSEYEKVTPLFFAVDYAYGPHDSDAVHTIQLLLDAGANILFEDQYRTGILHLAADAGMDWLVERCLDAGCDPNRVSKIHDTPLMAAFIQPRGRVIELLVLAGSSPNYSNEYGTTYLHEAARHKLNQWIRWQLAQEGDMLRLDSNGLSPAAYYVNAGGDDPDILKTFAYAGKGLSPVILRAITVGNTAVFDFMLENGIAFPVDSLHPFVTYAAANGKAKALAWLLTHGHSPHPSDGSTLPPLWAAVLARDTACVRLLLVAGADPNWVDAKGQSVLFAYPAYDSVALDREQMKRSLPRKLPSPVPVLEMLDLAGADFGMRDGQGLSPYDAAVNHLRSCGEHRLWYAQELRAFFVGRK